MHAPDAAAAPIAARQYGLITAHQALAVGFTWYMIRRRLDLGLWSELDVGVFHIGSVPMMWRARVLALCLGTGGLATHRAAARLYGLDGLRQSPIEVTVPQGHYRRRSEGVHETTQWDTMDETRLHGIPTTGPNRTLIDLAGMVEYRDFEVAVDSALRLQLVTWPGLKETHERLGGRGRRGSANLGALLKARYDSRPADSGGNRKVVRLLSTAGLPVPDVEHEVFDEGAFVARLDLAWPNRLVALELDSVRWHLNRQSFERDPRRRNRLTALGWTVLVITWADVTQRPSEVINTVRRVLDR
ncbi:MAG: hypothetical protein GY745_19050 [Actinomycetia bacterium]|nr:hypothetical protein [Actinomycetes bacterium]MCP4087120.1 hypothetical protein [Actinomycetes bacterium]